MAGRWVLNQERATSRRESSTGLARICVPVVFFSNTRSRRTSASASETGVSGVLATTVNDSATADYASACASPESPSLALRPFGLTAAVAFVQWSTLPTSASPSQRGSLPLYLCESFRARGLCSDSPPSSRCAELLSASRGAPDQPYGLPPEGRLRSLLVFARIRVPRTHRSRRRPQRSGHHCSVVCRLRTCEYRGYARRAQELEFHRLPSARHA